MDDENDEHFIKTNKENIKDVMKIDNVEFKFIDVTNWSKSFGFHLATKNVQVSVVLLKRFWKRKDNIKKYLKKKTRRRKSKDKQEIKIEDDSINKDFKYLKEVKTINPEEFTGDRKWCWDEFERHIGVPKRWDTKPELALAYIRAKRYQRFVPEARKLKKPQNPETVFLACDKPISKCLCPDKECFCTGNAIINENMKIPDDLRPNLLARWIPFLRKITTKKVDPKPFIDKLVEATGGSTQKLNQEMCLRRCRHYHVAGELLQIQYLPYFVRPSEKVIETKEFESYEGDEDDRVCNAFSCTVSTQTETLPGGELNVKKFSHLLFSKVEETYLPDIRGKKLQITHYKHVSSSGTDMQVCANNMEKLLDVKEMKFRFSKFLSSICENKDLGPPVRTCATQVPRRKRICDTFKFRAPNRCGDKDYDDIPQIPWSRKINRSLFDEPTKEEFEEDQDGDVCPCCELFAGSDIDKETLLDNIKNVLSLPRDVRISKPKNEAVEDDKNITDVKIIIKEIVENAATKLDENVNEAVKFIDHEGNEESGKQQVDNIERCRYSCCDLPIKPEKKIKETNYEGNENMKNTPNIEKELEMTEISNENRNEHESLDKNIVDTSEVNTENDSYKLHSGSVHAGTASNEITTEEKSNVKKTVKCDFLRRKKTNLSEESISESVTNDQKDPVTYLCTDVEVKSSINSKMNFGQTEINSSSKISDQEKLELSKDPSGINKSIKTCSIENSNIMKEQRDSSNIQNASKDKVILQVNTSYKKASSAFSSLFKWLFDQKSILFRQINKNSSLKSLSKNKSSDNNKLNLRDSKVSEREVFSVRYTSSTISVNKSASSGIDK